MENMHKSHQIYELRLYHIISMSIRYKYDGTAITIRKISGIAQNVKCQDVLQDHPRSSTITEIRGVIEILSHCFSPAFILVILSGGLLGVR